jgi:hypothetical protein
MEEGTVHRPPDVLHHGTSVHFGNGIRERLEGPVIFFLISFVSLRKVALSRSILCGHGPENQ